METTSETWSIGNNVILPSGFKIERYCKGNSINRMLSPRSLHVSQYQGSSILYVGSGTAFVYALIDYESDGVNDAVFTQIFQSTLSFTVYSIAVNEQEDSLYIDDGQNIYRCPNVHQQVLSMRSPQERLSNCSIWLEIPAGNRQFNTRYMKINPFTNSLCIAFGVQQNVIIPEGVDGTIRCFNNSMQSRPQSINDSVIYAHGVRDSVGFEFHPQIPDQLWFTDRGVDGFGDNGPDDELNRVTQIGQDFGFPFCHTQGYGPANRRTVGLSENIPDQTYEPSPSMDNETCDSLGYLSAEQPLGPHVEAMGMTFVFTERIIPNFPNRFILIAQHGSGNRRSTLLGYRVMMVELFGGQFQEVFDYRPFAEGWVDTESDTVYGRPVDVAWIESDDSFLVSDDYVNSIY